MSRGASVEEYHGVGPRFGRNIPSIASLVVGHRAELFEHVCDGRNISRLAVPAMVFLAARVGIIFRRSFPFSFRI